MKDIVPELLEKLIEEFKNAIESDKSIKNSYKKLENGTVNYDDAFMFSEKVGEILSYVLLNNLSSKNLPDGRMYYNIANRIIPEMLKIDHELVSEVSTGVINKINESAGIGIKARKPKLNEEKVKGIVDIVSGKAEFDKIAYMLKDPVINFSQCIVDDTVRENADFQYESGLNPKIIRTTTGKCCKWCNKIAGVYDYADIKQKKNHDVFRRHKHCDCKVEYLPGDGRRQNVHTKKWSRESKNDIITQEAGDVLTTLSKSVATERIPNRAVKGTIIREAIAAEQPVYADDLRPLFKKVKPKEGYMDICLHGTQFYTEYEHKYKLDTITLSYIISGRRDYRPDINNIRLLSCSTGKISENGDCVAQKLANLLGVDVYAPIDILYIGVDGSLTVGKRKLGEEEGFKLFEPKK